MAGKEENDVKPVGTLWGRGPAAMVVACCVSVNFSAFAMAGPREDFQKLDEQMSIAAQEYYDAMEKITTRQGTIKVGAKIPVDRRPEILRKMDALADSVAGTPPGGVLAAQTFLRSLEMQSPGTFARLQGLVGQYADEPVFEDVLDLLPYAYRGLADADDWASTLERLARTTTRPQTKLAAYVTAGQIRLDVGQTKRAKELFRKLLKLAEEQQQTSPRGEKPEKRTPGADYIASAKGFLFELEHLQVGMVAPDFATHTLEGKEISLRSLRGKVVLLNFWATWCVNCVAEIPHLKTAVSKLKNQPFEILAVSVDDDRQSLLQLIHAMAIPGIHTWDPKGPENPVASLYHVYRYPTQYLIDPNGVIRARDPDVTTLPAQVKALLPMTK